MSEQTAIKAREALDNDCWAVRISVNQIIGILNAYIPRACQVEAEHKLFDALFINGTELTSNTMRKEYEAWKQIQIESFLAKPPTS